MRRLTVTIVAVVLARPVLASTEGELGLEDALARARERAPAILAARERVEEARARLAGASVLLRDNPLLEATGGPRLGEERTTAAASTSLTQVFELGGRRAARIAGAEAGLEREAATGEDELRRLLRDVAAAFWHAVAAGERLRLLATAEGVAADMEHTSERRHAAGDVADLDLNLTRIAAARARSERYAAEAGRAEALGELSVLLGMAPHEPLRVQGDLRRHGTYELAALLARVGERPDVRALAAEVREAEADVRLGRGLAWPEVGLRAGYERDEGDDIPLAGFTVALPMFARGQELRATGSARARRLGLELAARRRAAEVDVLSAHEVYRRRLEAVAALEGRALPGLDDNEGLARRSYEEREMSLPELLLLRREALAIRAEYVARLLEAALAEVELQARAGVLP